MAPSSRPLDGVAVLVVDDNFDTRHLLKVTLTQSGALTAVAENGKDGLHLLTCMRVDVIVSDLLMPRFSGFDFIRAVRTETLTPDIPAIALTAYDDPDAREAAMRAGFQSFRLKPFDVDALVNEIAELGRSRQAARLARHAAAA